LTQLRPGVFGADKRAIGKILGIRRAEQTIFFMVSKFSPLIHIQLNIAVVNPADHFPDIADFGMHKGYLASGPAGCSH